MKGQEFNSLTADNRMLRDKAKSVCFEFNRTPSKGNLRNLRQLFSECGEQVIIEQGFKCDYGVHIELGDRVFINSNCTFLDGGRVKIGDDCLIGPNVQILTINHDLNPTKRLEKLSYALDVTVEGNVWIGAAAIICPGVTIGEGSVIAAGSIVTKDIDSNVMAAGNPAKIIKSIENT